jgi:hypothetical protein
MQAAHRNVNPGLVIIAMAALWLGAAIGLRGFLARGEVPTPPIEAQASLPAAQPAPIQVEAGHAGTPIDEPLLAGPFRIVSPDWVEPNPASSASVLTAPATNVSSNSAPFDPHDLATLKASRYWTTIGYAPPGYTLGAPVASAISNGNVDSITWNFEDKDFRGFEMFRATWDLPIEIQRPAADGHAQLEVDQVNGNPAVFIRNKAGQSGPQILYVVDGQGVLTVIDGEIADFNEFIKMAESMTPTSR